MSVVDVAVVGAGPHGLALALGLARAGARVEVLDPGLDPRLPWTEVHHWSVLPGLDELGVLDELVALGRPTPGWGLRVLATGEHLTYDLGELGGELRHPYHLRVADPDLRRVLTRELLARPGAGIRPGGLRALSRDGDRVALEVDRGPVVETVHASWVVAADGASSVTRREAGIAFSGSSAGERSVIALVDHDFAAAGYPSTTFQVDARLGAVVEHVEGTTWRYVFQEPAAWPEDAVPSRIDEVLRQVTGARPRLLDWTTERTHQRTAATYRAGRVLLVGDAAHVTHRMIGHSSIAGWFDVASLTDALAAVLRGSAGDDTLDHWAAVRRRVYLDEAVPASLSRKHLVTQIADPARLTVELDEFRRAVADRSVRRDVLRRGCELAGGFRTPEPRLLPSRPAS